MYWIIKEKREKQIPRGYRDLWGKENSYLQPAVYKNPIWIESGSCLGDLGGEPIEREYWFYLVVKLCESKRVKGKPKRKTIFTANLPYWHIINDVFWIPNGDDYLSRIDCNLNNIELGNDTPESLIELLECKLKPFIDGYREHYKSGIEYQHLQENIDLHKKHIDLYFEEQAKEKKKESQAEVRARMEERRKQREYGAGWNNSSSDNYSGALNVNMFKQPASNMEKEIVKAGYRALSKKYHPDSMGDNKKFIELSEAKDSLLTV